MCVTEQVLEVVSNNISDMAFVFLHYEIVHGIEQATFVPNSHFNP